MDAAKVSRIKAPRKDLPQNLWRQDGRDVAVTFFVEAKMVTFFDATEQHRTRERMLKMDAIEGTPKKGYRMLQSR